MTGSKETCKIIISSVYGITFNWKYPNRDIRVTIYIAFRFTGRITSRDLINKISGNNHADDIN